ncbi:MAG: EamA family transporter [Emergencia sp.]|nr:EamA family transporter [Emergencia sp.]
MTREYAYAGITIFLWGSSFAVIGLMVKELHPMVMLFFNSLVAFLFLFALNTAQGKLKKGRSGIKKKELHVLVLLGLMTFFYNAMIN